jgi:hypothetical protein
LADVLSALTSHRMGTNRPAPSQHIIVWNGEEEKRRSGITNSRENLDSSLYMWIAVLLPNTGGHPTTSVLITEPFESSSARVVIVYRHSNAGVALVQLLRASRRDCMHSFSFVCTPCLVHAWHVRSNSDGAALLWVECVYMLASRIPVL